LDWDAPLAGSWDKSIGSAQLPCLVRDGHFPEMLRIHESTEIDFPCTIGCPNQLQEHIHIAFLPVVGCHDRVVKVWRWRTGPRFCFYFNTQAARTYKIKIILVNVRQLHLSLLFTPFCQHILTQKTDSVARAFGEGVPQRAHRVASCGRSFHILGSKFAEKRHGATGEWRGRGNEKKKKNTQLQLNKPRTTLRACVPAAPAGSAVYQLQSGACETLG
jgi:hypothetical protein